MAYLAHQHIPPCLRFFRFFFDIQGSIHELTGALGQEQDIFGHLCFIDLAFFFSITDLVGYFYRLPIWGPPPPPHPAPHILNLMSHDIEMISSGNHGVAKIVRMETRKSRFSRNMKRI